MEVKRMKISAIVVTNNEKNTIEKRLKNIVRQTKLVDEIILIDDHSTDHTMEVAEKFLHRHKLSFRMLRTDHESGKRECYLMGLGMAHGDYLLIGEGKWKVDHVEKIMEMNKDVVVEGKPIQYLALDLMEHHYTNDGIMAIRKGIVLTETENLLIKAYLTDTLGILDGEDHLVEVDHKEERYEELVSLFITLKDQGFDVVECNQQLGYYKETKSNKSSFGTKFKALRDGSYKKYENGFKSFMSDLH